MTRRPSLFRQSDLLRAMKAAQKAGDGWDVVVGNGGEIRLSRLKSGPEAPQETANFADRGPKVF